MCVTGTDLVTHFLCHGTGSTGILLIARVSAALPMMRAIPLS